MQFGAKKDVALPQQVFFLTVWQISKCLSGWQSNAMLT